jgi:hypothetical protein
MAAQSAAAVGDIVMELRGIARSGLLYVNDCSKNKSPGI